MAAGYSNAKNGGATWLASIIPIRACRHAPAGEPRGDPAQVVLADALHAPLGRQEHVASPLQAGEPTLAHEVADDLAARLFGSEKAYDIVCLDDIPTLFAE